MSKRRGHGEGGICRLANGKWCATVDLGMVNGKRKRKYIYAKTRKEVVDKLKVAQAAQARGVNIVPERYTVERFLKMWLDEVIRGQRRPRTYESYKYTVEKYLIPHIGTHQLTRLN